MKKRAVPVLFRVWRGVVVAVFPTEPTSSGLVESFDRRGWGERPLSFIDETRAATPREYASWKVELRARGLHLDVRDRWARDLSEGYQYNMRKHGFFLKSAPEARTP